MAAPRMNFLDEHEAGQVASAVLNSLDGESTQVS